MSYDILELPLTKVHPDPDQPRKYFHESKIQELAESIAQHSLLQPILVRPWNGEYQIVHGERRYRAHQLLNKPAIKAHIRELTDRQVEDIRLVENIERDDLSDIELAWEFKKRIDKGQTHQEIADTIGKTTSFVTQRLALLELSERNQKRLLHGELSFSNARLLLQVRDLDRRREISQKIGPDTTVKEARSLIDDSQPKP